MKKIIIPIVYLVTTLSISILSFSIIKLINPSSAQEANLANLFSSSIGIIIPILFVVIVLTLRKRHTFINLLAFVLLGYALLNIMIRFTIVVLSNPYGISVVFTVVLFLVSIIVLILDILIIGKYRQDIVILIAMIINLLGGVINTLFYTGLTSQLWIRVLEVDTYITIIRLLSYTGYVFMMAMPLLIFELYRLDEQSDQISIETQMTME